MNPNTLNLPYRHGRRPGQQGPRPQLSNRGWVEKSATERTNLRQMRMLRWILGVSLRDRRRNEDIRQVLGVACITDKVREARMRWYGHVMRRGNGCCIKRIVNAEVYGRRSRGRQKKRWRDKIQEDLKTLKLKKEDDDDDRNKWRRRIRVADP